MMTGSGFGGVGERSRATRTLSDTDTFFSPERVDTYTPESPLVTVIDDSMAVRRVVEISLLRAGIQATSYPDGLAAMMAWQSGEIAPPRVLLLDIGMPRMSGYEVAKLVRANPAFSETRIVMLSGHDGVVDRTRARFYGASDFISKPFKPADLVSRVRRALGLPGADAEWPM